MNFELTEEHLMIQKAARDYAQRELLQDVLERDEKAEFPARHIKNLAELGFMGMTVDSKYDGAGMDTVSYVLAMEELSKVDSSVSVIMSVNNSLVCYGIERYGTEEQKQKYLKRLARGEIIGAFLLSEPEAGSDATHQHTRAENKGDYYLLNGTKNWITSANSGSVYLVMAQTHPEKKHHGINAFIVEKDTPGISLGPHEDKRTE
jgi:alkylation response protein AidB-like acyl-CoA dehydrogenase